MPEIAVGEGVGAVLEPDDDGVNLADGPDERVVDVVIDNVGCHKKTEGCIDTVGPGNGVPCCLKRAGCLNGVFLLGVGVCRSFHTTEGTSSMLSCAQFQKVGNEQMAWDEGVEKGTEENVLAPIVMAAYADENAILYPVSE